MGVRDSAAIGVMMNTRGVIEIILLTVGREQGLIDDRLFTMLALMAIFTTLLTVPTPARDRPGRTRRCSPRRATNRRLPPDERRVALAHEVGVRVAAEVPAQAGNHQLEHASRIRFVNRIVKKAMKLITPVSQYRTPAIHR